MAIVVIVVAIFVAAWLLAFLLLPWLCSINPPKPFPSSTGDGRAGMTVLLLVAHPDDESMFFGPTILSLTSLGGYNVRVLSISNGNAGGKGAERENEMRRACSVFKVPMGNVNVLNIPKFQDGFHEVWNQDALADILQNEVEAHDVDVGR